MQKLQKTTSGTPQVEYLYPELSYKLNGILIVDFTIEELIALELKTTAYLINEHYDQVKRYLHETGLKLGILVNFRNKKIYPKRILNINNLIRTI
ncbi:MAG: GxxExxY protein [Patescibacteria group bacterium]|nr:GxxExxY protein [Patescibacteria group bacterium]